jgi:hypothetical protein
MPPLTPPLVVAPLSECSTQARVQNQLIGATVAIFANGAHVGGGVATWSDEVFPLTAPLIAGHVVTAKQTFGGSTSPATPPADGVIVQKKPPVVGTVGFSSQLWNCGQCLHLDGMVPGATINVWVGGALAATGSSVDGTVRLGLSVPLSSSKTVSAQQTACGIVGTMTPGPTPSPWPREQALPTPTIDTPLKECERSVTVSNVLDGAVVTLTRTAGPPAGGCFDYSAEYFTLAPLVLNETVTAEQAFPPCGSKSLQTHAKVGPAQPVPVPTVVGPLCAGGTIVTVSGLTPGCELRVLANGVVIAEGGAGNATAEIIVPPLAANAAVTAEQQLCSFWSAASPGVTVNPRPATIPNPTVPGPLYACGAVVRVTNVTPGSAVAVHSQLLGGEIGWQVVSGTFADIPVSPQLILGDHIFATEVACGGTPIQSNHVLVRRVPRIAPPMIAAPVDDCMRSVTVIHVIPGAHVDVEVNGAWRGSAIAGATSVEVQLSGVLHVNDLVRARQRLCAVITAYGEGVTVVSNATLNYLTQHFDVARTGWRPYETTLTVTNVPAASQLFALTVDAQVYAQPLYVHHVNVAGQGAHNVLYVATENDSIYAFDADVGGQPLWRVALVQPGESAMPVADISPCTNVAPLVGITSTPVIDCSSRTLYAVAKTASGSGSSMTLRYRLHALDLTSGAERPGSPVDITGTYPGSAQPSDGKGNVVFSAQWQLNRPALLLANNTIYVAFGSHCDNDTWHGWIMGYDKTSLAQIAAFCTTPDGQEGGIWQGGIGPASDPQGFIYLNTANGDFTVNTGRRDYGDTVLKLTTNLTVASWFTPADQSQLFGGDIDLGSGGVLILPDNPTGQRPLLVSCGKDGNMMLLDRTALGGYSGPSASGTYGANANAVQTLLLNPGTVPNNQIGPWGGPAFYSGPGGAFIYYCGNDGTLRAFNFSGVALSPSIVGGMPNVAADSFPGAAQSGATPVVSSNGQVAGTAVLWAIVRELSAGRLGLRAYDATDLRSKLLEKDAGPWGNTGGTPMIEPTVVGGKIYVGGDGQVTVFGL